MDTQSITYIVVNMMTLAFFAGIVWTKMHMLEKKQDKYNNIQERIALNEQSVKSAHHRIDDLKN